MRVKLDRYRVFSVKSDQYIGPLADCKRDTIGFVSLCVSLRLNMSAHTFLCRVDLKFVVLKTESRSFRCVVKMKMKAEFKNGCHVRKWARKQEVGSRNYEVGKG